jgi:hypothetical protein
MTGDLSFNNTQVISESNQVNIKPFRGILKNALQKRFKVKTSRMFAEDSIEEIYNLNFEMDEHSSYKSKIVDKRSLGRMIQKQSTIKTTNVGFHQMVSSRDSMDLSQVTQNDNINNLLRKRQSIQKISSFKNLNYGKLSGKHLP